MEKTQNEFQRKQAIECFNKTWDYLDMPTRSEQDDLEMIHCAHASRFLWGQVGENVHFARGEWLISKVYVQINDGESAIRHAKACLQISIESKLEAFDLAFAHEAMAQAYKLLKDVEGMRVHRDNAYEALNTLAQEDENYAYTKGELDKI